MRLINKTKNLPIAENVEVADNFFKKIKGLMFSKKFRRPLLITFSRETRKTNAIHSIFVFFQFDAVFLDSKKVVVDIKRVKPFTFLIIPKKPAKYVIELNRGEARKKKIEIDDRVAFAR